MCTWSFQVPPPLFTEDSGGVQLSLATSDQDRLYEHFSEFGLCFQKVEEGWRTMPPSIQGRCVQTKLRFQAWQGRYGPSPHEERAVVFPSAVWGDCADVQGSHKGQNDQKLLCLAENHEPCDRAEQPAVPPESAEIVCPDCTGQRWFPGT